VITTHLLPYLGDRKLDSITNEDVQELKHQLEHKAPKTVNNVLTVLNVLLKAAVEWKEIAVMPCSIRLLKTPKSSAQFHDFDDFERLVEAARQLDGRAYLIVLLGGEAGLRCGEMMALEWKDVDLSKRQLTVERSDWKGHVTSTKGDRVRHVPMTQKVVQDHVRRAARRANVKPGVHILRHTFCSHLAMRGAPARAIQAVAGTRTFRPRSGTCTSVQQRSRTRSACWTSRSGAGGETGGRRTQFYWCSNYLMVLRLLS